MDSQPAPSPAEYVSVPPPPPVPDILLTLPFAFSRKSKRLPLKPIESTQREIIPLLRDPLHMDIILRVNEFSVRAYRFLEWPHGATVEMQNDPASPELSALFLRFADGRHQMIASQESAQAAGELLDAIAEGIHIRWNVHLYRSGALTATPDAFWADDVETSLQTTRLHPEFLASLLKARDLPDAYEIQPLHEGVLPFMTEATFLNVSQMFLKPIEPSRYYAYRSTVLEIREYVLEHLRRDQDEA